MPKVTRRNSDDASSPAADRGRKPAIDTAINFSQHDIARRAYDLYLARGGEPGHQLQDWLQAEQDLRERSLATIV
jgi:hypothetical protein